MRAKSEHRRERLRRAGLSRLGRRGERGRGVSPIRGDLLAGRRGRQRVLHPGGRREAVGRLDRRPGGDRRHARAGRLLRRGGAGGAVRPEDDRDRAHADSGARDRQGRNDAGASRGTRAVGPLHRVHAAAGTSASRRTCSISSSTRPKKGSPAPCCCGPATARRTSRTGSCRRSRRRRSPRWSGPRPSASAPSSRSSRGWASSGRAPPASRSARPC